MNFTQTAWSQPRTPRQEVLTRSTDGYALAGYLLAWAVPVVFCSGLVGLAVSPLCEATPPRWLIVTHGLGCSLLALLATLLGRPGRPVEVARPAGRALSRPRPAARSDRAEGLVRRPAREDVESPPAERQQPV
jgi:hypothetical protein